MGRLGRKLTVLVAVSLAAWANAAMSAPPAAVSECQLVSQRTVAKVLGLPHTRLVQFAGECRYLAWSQPQEPRGVRGPKPVTVTIWAARSSTDIQAARLSLELSLARRAPRVSTAPFAIPRFGEQHAAAFATHKSWREQSGTVTSSEFRGIWWTARSGRIQKGVEILISDWSSQPVSLNSELAGIGATAVPALLKQTPHG